MANEKLTRQETKMIGELVSGKLYKEIAADNFISINTVKKHLKNSYRKLKTGSRYEARQWYKKQDPFFK